MGKSFKPSLNEKSLKMVEKINQTFEDRLELTNKRSTEKL